MKARSGFFGISFLLFLVIIFMLTGCGGGVENNDAGNTAPGSQTSGIPGNQNSDQSQGTSEDRQEASQTPDASGNSPETVNEGSTAPQNTAPDIDLEAVKPDESGKIMVVMFHNFIEKYEKGDKNYVTTFDAFGNLLQELYNDGYRLISLNDYLADNIDVPAGCIPMVFTFDDGTPGQFNLVDENGVMTANRMSAVGIMEDFNREHPDFGLKGTFFVNLGDQTFGTTGTLAERLKYLVSEGFEIGNHTYTHIDLKKAKSAEEIEKEIGGNQNKMYELIPGYKFISFSLPYGEPSEDLQQYVIKGEYEGTAYENKAIVEVGWDPALSPVNPKFNPLSIHRVRASGLVPVDCDLAWWLKNLKRSDQYVSDGNPETVTVPESRVDNVDVSKLNGKKLITY